MAKTYSIHVKGQLAVHWSHWFDGLTINTDAYGDTILSGTLVDQAALWGVLSRIRDLGLTLLAVHSEDEAAHDTAGNINHIDEAS